ncbi:helix-turn-helix domain-containing protein [Bisbaumannia pacifica]|uniref:helix-turn-helix domain-containing protein n=1 Tax=Bisbaumannia pacifica TaxID=77098 RepID=UPI003BEF4575
MGTTTFRNLRVALGISPERFAARCQMSLDELTAIESGAIEPSNSFIDTYSKTLNIRKDFLSLLFKGTRRRSPAFESIRKCFLRILNGYLKLSLWMTEKDETTEKLPR